MSRHQTDCRPGFVSFNESTPSARIAAGLIDAGLVLVPTGLTIALTETRLPVSRAEDGRLLLAPDHQRLVDAVDQGAGRAQVIGDTLHLLPGSAVIATIGVFVAALVIVHLIVPRLGVGSTPGRRLVGSAAHRTRPTIDPAPAGGHPTENPPTVRFNADKSAVPPAGRLDPPDEPGEPAAKPHQVLDREQAVEREQVVEPDRVVEPEQVVEPDRCQDDGGPLRLESEEGDDRVRRQVFALGVASAATGLDLGMPPPPLPRALRDPSPRHRLPQCRSESTDTKPTETAPCPPETEPSPPEPVPAEPKPPPRPDPPGGLETKPLWNRDQEAWMIYDRENHEWLRYDSEEADWKELAPANGRQ